MGVLGGTGQGPGGPSAAHRSWGERMWEEQAWGKSEPACHLKASRNTHSMLGLVHRPGPGEVNEPGSPSLAPGKSTLLSLHYELPREQSVFQV